MSVEPLELDTDPEAYLALHDLLDEPAADAGLTDREREVRRRPAAWSPTRWPPGRPGWTRPQLRRRERAGAGPGGTDGLVFPGHLGGSGDTNVAYAVAMEEVTAGCAATSLVFMTQMHAAPILTGSEELARRYIPACWTARSTARSGSPSRTPAATSSSLQTTARPTGSGYVLNGSKTFITTGDRAGVIVCFATVDRAGAAKESPRSSSTAAGRAWAAGSLRQARHARLHAPRSCSSTMSTSRRTTSSARSARAGRVVLSSVVKSRISAAAQGWAWRAAAYAPDSLGAVADLRTPAAGRLTFALADLRGQILQGRLLLRRWRARSTSTAPRRQRGRSGS